MKKLIPFLVSFLMICPDMFAQGGVNNLWFDGADDYVNCGSDSTLDLREQLTIEAWIKGDPNNYSYTRIVDKYQFFAQQGFNLVRETASNSVMLDFGRQTEQNIRPLEVRLYLTGNGIMLRQLLTGMLPRCMLTATLRTS